MQQAAGVCASRVRGVSAFAINLISVHGPQLLASDQRDVRDVLEVRDAGTGIPADELPRLFDRLHRVKGARSRSYEGSGVALAQALVRC